MTAFWVSDDKTVLEVEDQYFYTFYNLNICVVSTKKLIDLSAFNLVLKALIFVRKWNRFEKYILSRNCLLARHFKMNKRKDGSSYWSLLWPGQYLTNSVSRTTSRRSFSKSCPTTWSPWCWTAPTCPGWLRLNPTSTWGTSTPRRSWLATCTWWTRTTSCSPPTSGGEITTRWRSWTGKFGNLL